MTRDELKQSLLQEEANIKARLKLFDTFEDLEVVSFARNQIGYGTKFVNGIATPETIQLRTERGCGCCSDSPYYVSPFIKIYGINVYALPVNIYIGDGLYFGSGIEPYEGRIKIYEKALFSEAIIEKIENYLAQHPPIYDIDEDND